MCKEEGWSHSCLLLNTAVEFLYFIIINIIKNFHEITPTTPPSNPKRPRLGEWLQGREGRKVQETIFETNEIAYAICENARMADLLKNDYGRRGRRTAYFYTVLQSQLLRFLGVIYIVFYYHPSLHHLR